MQASGGCHCGAIRYSISGDPVYHAICHCSDCRKASGAPAVSWALFSRTAVKIEGNASVYASSVPAQRHFCGACGTSLFYTNETTFPGMIDVQSATLDDPGALPLQLEVQTAERISWMPAAEVPQFERYPKAP